jgi:hypothetical protein
MKIYWEHDGEHIGNLINMLEFNGNFMGTIQWEQQKSNTPT